MLESFALSAFLNWSKEDMKTTKITAADIKQNWVVVDASGQTLGRLATENCTRSARQAQAYL